jgi:hypothetical protein
VRRAITASLAIDGVEGRERPGALVHRVNRPEEVRDPEVFPFLHVWI